MLVEKNEICKIIENRLRINFDELELVGKYDNYFDTLLYKSNTLLYKSNNKLYTIQIYENKISSISKVEKIESEKEPNCFMTTMINGIMYYIKYKELLYITKCDRKYNYIHFKNGKTLVKGDLLIEDAEMVMIKMLDDFINEEVVKQWGGWLNDDKENLYNR